eukprot:2379360-Heterocapsa_arctica.AAC.1
MPQRAPGQAAASQVPDLAEASRGDLEEQLPRLAGLDPRAQDASGQLVVRPDALPRSRLRGFAALWHTELHRRTVLAEGDVARLDLLPV